MKIFLILNFISITPKNIKYLGIKLTKDGQDLFIENYTMLREIKEDLSK